MTVEIIGINFQTAPLAVRERLAVTADGMQQMLSELCQHTDVSEVAILSTCNRTEFICAYGTKPRSAQQPYDGLPDRSVYYWLNQRLNALLPTHSDTEYSQLNSGVSDADEVKPYLYRHVDNNAARHLFRVIAGLDSMVLGEPQIHGQVKQAYQLARDANTLGSTLERLFQRSFYVAKKIRSNTAIGELPVSVAFAAITLAKRLFTDLSEHKVLLVGAGETSALLGRHLLEQGVSEFMVANRSLPRAQSLAAELSGTAHTLSELPEILAQADLVFTSTGADHALLSLADFKAALKKRRRRPIFAVDLAVPRDIDAAVSDLDDVYLYTVDDLSAVVDAGLNTRQAAAEQAELLINHELESFAQWQQSLNADDIIRQLRERGETMRDQAVARALKQLNAGQSSEAVLQQLATQLTNKWLHQPSLALRVAAGDETLSNAAKALFNLDDAMSDDNVLAWFGQPQQTTLQDKMAESNQTIDSSHNQAGLIQHKRHKNHKDC